MFTLADPESALPASMLACAPPRAGCVVSVVIPVRDEESRLLATLLALAGQIDLDGSRLSPDRYEIILLVNNSTDRSADIARAFASRNPDLALHVVEIDLPDDEAHVGCARRILMDAAAARLGPRGVIATTDADTTVAPDWIAATLAEIAAGANAVFGRILVDPAGFAEFGPHARLFHLRDVTYRYLVAELESRLAPNPFDPWPRHFQHFGPSIAVTVDAYCRAGGIPPLPLLEDVALYDALRRIRARVRHSPSVRVMTSSRPDGRTGFGFAGQLGRWAEMGELGEPFLVESVPAIIARVTARGKASIRETTVPIETAIGDLRRVLGDLRTGRVAGILAFEEVQPVLLLAAAD